MEDYKEKMRSNAWTKAMQAFGVSHVYGMRVRRAKVLVRWSKVLGIVLPVTVGAMTGSYFQDQQIMNVVILVSSPIAVAQLVFSVILTVGGTEDSLVKDIELSTKNLLLSEDFRQLGAFASDKEDELKLRYNVLCERERSLLEQDRNISPKEERIGMRYGLREFQRECVACKKVPISMKPTDCEVCGNF